MDCTIREKENEICKGITEEGKRGVICCKLLPSERKGRYQSSHSPQTDLIYLQCQGVFHCIKCKGCVNIFSSFILVQKSCFKTCLKHKK